MVPKREKTKSYWAPNGCDAASQFRELHIGDAGGASIGAPDLEHRLHAVGGQHRTAGRDGARELNRGLADAPATKMCCARLIFG